jgi:uncharacterized protein YegP (UPF0339 family)
MNNPKLEIYQSSAPTPEAPGHQDWRWRLKAANGEIVANGEGYVGKRDAERGFKDMAKATLMVVIDRYFK